jgi:hypothetical protein
MRVRRVVTGHDASGKAVVASDTEVDGIRPALTPGTTDTIDFEVVLYGEVWLELDDGVEVHLRAGDTVVQNGTRHAWRNHGDTTARLAVFIVGAHHDRVSRQLEERRS